MQRLKIIELKDGGQAKHIGLQIGDFLNTYNNIPLKTSESLSEVMRKHEGEVHKLHIIRDFQGFEINVTAGSLGIDVIPNYVADISDPEEVRQAQIRRLAENMPISTTPFMPGFRTVKVVNIVTSECVLGINMLMDLFASVSDIVGGRSKTTQSALRDARYTCLRELKSEAAQIGANAIIGVSFHYSELSGGGKSMLFLVASGTAVCIEP
ncbi:MAG: heavy metal-binding domain-containing protein [Candidatus Competibacter sp.]|nr:heavy metal-binding domain-containing protein [Candidatus Competibacter sp.]